LELSESLKLLELLILSVLSVSSESPELYPGIFSLNIELLLKYIKVLDLRLLARHLEGPGGSPVYLYLI